MPKRFLLSERSARILAGMARQNGAGSGSSGASSDARRHLSPPVPTTPDMHLIRVDDDTPDADGYYDATLIFYNAPEETFEELQEIKAIEPNDIPLQEQYYLARRHGENPDGSPVFSVIAIGYGNSSIQVGTGIPSHAAPAGTLFYSTDYFILFVNYNGTTGWTNAYGTAYDYLGRLVYSRVAITGTTTISANHRVQHTVGGSGPYTITHRTASGLDTEHYSFHALPTLTGIVTLDGNSTEEIQGPRGSGSPAQSIKLVRNEHIWIESDGSNHWVLAHTMLEVGFSATHSTTQSVGSGSPVKVEFDTLTWDINSGFDTTNDRFLPLAPGIYNVQCGVPLESLADGNRFKLMIYKNGSPYLTLANLCAGGAGDMMLSGGCEISLNGSTDYVEVFVEHDNGGSINTVHSGADVVWFHGSRIRRDES